MQSPCDDVKAAKTDRNGGTSFKPFCKINVSPMRSPLRRKKSFDGTIVMRHVQYNYLQNCSIHFSETLLGTLTYPGWETLMKRESYVMHFH